MNEPKQQLIRDAVMKKYPEATSIFINHRKHTMRVTFKKPKAPAVHLDFSARTHRELLELVQA